MDNFFQQQSEIFLRSLQLHVFIILSISSEKSLFYPSTSRYFRS